MIVIGVDAHMRTHTAAAVNGLTARFIEERTIPARAPGFRALLEWALGLDEERVWAIEDVRNLSGGLERFLLAEGERVLRVPPKLMAGQRKSARTLGKSDSIDALVVARMALREERMQPAFPANPAQQQIKLLAQQRDFLLRQANCAQRRLRWLLHDMNPDLQPAGRTLNQAAVLDRLARQLARRQQTVQVRLCRELIIDIRALTRRCTALHHELAPLVRAYAPGLLQVCGVATLTAAKLISEIEDITRFENDAQLAMYGGVAPIDASSGQQHRHRLNRSGNRQFNHALYLIAVTQVRVHQPARDYIARRIAEGKSRKEALRALKRYIARQIFRVLTADAHRTKHPPQISSTAPLGCLT